MGVYVMKKYSISEIQIEQSQEVDYLYEQLSPGKNRHLSQENISNFQSHFKFFGAKELDESLGNAGKIVSIATLALVYTGEKCFGQVHEVVTDEHHRGKQFGRSMSLAEEVMLYIADYAKKIGLAYLEITSKPSREVADKLYRKVGYKLVAQAVDDTGVNLYSLYL